MFIQESQETVTTKKIRKILNYYNNIIIHDALQIKYDASKLYMKDVCIKILICFKDTENKAIRKEKREIIKTLKHNDLSNQLKLEICDSVFFPVVNNETNIHSQMKIPTSSEHQQYDFNIMKIGGIWILTVSVGPFKPP